MEANYQAAYDAQVDFFKVYDPLEEAEIEEEKEEEPTLNGQSYC